MKRTPRRLQAIAQRALLGLTLLAAQPALAADNFTASFLQDGQFPVTIGSSTLAGIFGAIDGARISTDGSTFNLTLRGTGATVTGFLDGGDGAPFPYVGRIALPSIGAVSEDFGGPTWKVVLDQVRQYLLARTQAKALARESARISPFDPVAGNPSSLMARVVAYDFGSAFFPFASNIADDTQKLAQLGGGLPAGAVRGPMPTLPGVGLQLGLLRDSGQSVRSLTLPLSLSFRSDLDPRRQISLYLPLTVSDVNGARTTQGTLGAALRLPLARDWAISTNAGYSLLKATDLGAAGKIASLSVTSSYVIRGEGSDLGIGNMIGHYRTLGGSVGGIATGSGIANTVFRNGLLWSMPAPAGVGFGRSLEFTLVNTHYTGSDLYLRNYTELGVAAGTNRRADSQRSYMQGGVSMLLSGKTRGLLVHYGHWF